MANYRQINREVMEDTQRQYESVPELIAAVQESIERQYMVAQEDLVDVPAVDVSSTQYVVSGKRTLEAAKGYKGMKVAVLNFANNHSIGGSPFSAGAQEESICRCSTLYPCLVAMKQAFYDYHNRLRASRQMDHMGNDDLIYTPDVVVFKTDELADIIYPKMMPQDDWYKVDVITCAAPELWHGYSKPDDYEAKITSRIKRILDVAAKEKVEALILGKWGCGAFRNPLDVVARVFKTLLKNYDFKIVEFGLSTAKDFGDDVFVRELGYLTPLADATQSRDVATSYNREFTPDRIRTLGDGEIFVFGSNIHGHHGGGAAYWAHQSFGAEWGVGEGLTGQCYALPTMEGGVDYINSKVQIFLECAKQHPELKFYVTRIACGIAGFTPQQIAPLFKDAIPMENVILPRDFVSIIEA